jgi:MFS family permease
MSTEQPSKSVIYGWVIVVIAAYAMLATLPGRTHGLGMITERLLSDERFQLDRVKYAEINLWATLLGGLFCLPCGWFIDKCGLRLSLTVTLLALSAAVLGMTQVSDLSMFSLTILLTRGFGQSALSVVSITMVGKWFPRRTSFPMAVYSLLMSLGFTGAFVIAKRYLADDWRVLWSGMGYILAASAPIALILTREPPRQESNDSDLEANISQPGFTLWQAMRTQAYWVFGIAISLVALLGSGMSLFNESVLTQQGFPKETYYDLATITGSVGLLVMLPIGWLGRFVPLNRMLSAGLLLQSTCMALLPFVHSRMEIILYGIGMGIGGTTTTVLFFTIWGQAFGKAHLGQIQSIAQMLTVLASSLGPVLFAKYFAQFQSYAGIFYTLASVAAVIAVWSWLIRVPSPDEASSTAISAERLEGIPDLPKAMS